MRAHSVPKPSHELTVNLATAKSLKRTLETEFSVALSPIQVLEAYHDRLPDNPFARSLLDVPLRQLGGLMATQDKGLLRMALRGEPLQGAIRSQSSDAGPPPRMSVGYRRAADDGFALEVRLQHADPQSLLRAKTLVQERVGAEVPIGLISKVRALVGGVFPGALNNDPLTIGSSVAHVAGDAGTLGVFVQKGKKTGFLSCSHVLSNCGNAAVGDPIHHPAPADDRLQHLRIGELKLFEDLRLKQTFKADAAFAEIAPGIAVAGNMIPTGQSWPGEGMRLGSVVVGNIPEPDAKVVKLGRTTGRTTGRVSLENVGPIDIYMAPLGGVTVEGLTEVRWDSLNRPFSNFGDSGSLVYLESNLAPVGILIAGGERLIDNARIGVSYVCPLHPILQAWGLTLS